jgi:hypothetical protein
MVKEWTAGSFIFCALLWGGVFLGSYQGLKQVQTPSKHYQKHHLNIIKTLSECCLNQCFKVRSFKSVRIWLNSVNSVNSLLRKEWKKCFFQRNSSFEVLSIYLLPNEKEERKTSSCLSLFHSKQE